MRDEELEVNPEERILVQVWVDSHSFEQDWRLLVVLVELDERVEDL